ncbi:MAG: BMP family ABC transporter substrate-binding protein, partial [Mogibacterium sp.]|nr:BMP family ABC transporter substrate-binding protein [Mogibacterium sp.]
GVDVDQSNQSDAVVTSAMKGLAQSVQVSLTNFYGEGLQTGALVLGAADDAVGLPVDTWALQNWSVDEYNALFEQIKSGEITVDNSEVADPSTAGLENITFVQ